MFKQTKIKAPKHRTLINQVQSTNEPSPDPPVNVYTIISELQLNHINCESTDDENETENTLIKNMLKIEHEYEKPNESNYYQNDYTKLDLQEIRNNQDNTKYTLHILEKQLKYE